MLPPYTQDEYMHEVRRITLEDPRYHAAAYLFVGDAVRFTAEHLQRANRHVTTAELLDGLRQCALDRFGPLARDVLAAWGVARTEDFGNLVFAMIRHGLLGADQADSTNDFAGGFDFEDAFLVPFQPCGAARKPPTIA